ncbi:hypothetical protein CVU37_14305 [candidate division BRC1 bacterium HGW-BRC1-1]|jgi:rubrerythrin|nr:MAG: hypothetical protein CVU37_14305 [candidate division BRC1 bacterium HGW-BRC1-1]
MTFKRGKQKFTKGEIIDILKRNVSLFRDEDEFVQYIVDLAMYLVEHRLYNTSEAGDAGESAAPAQEVISPTKTPEGIEKRSDRFTRTRERDKELYRVLKKHSTRSEMKTNCRMCGAPTGGAAICPNCGNMAL